MTTVVSTTSAGEVASAFGLGRPTSELISVARGAMGLVFRLDTDAGAVAVKKLFHEPWGGEAENVAFQLAALEAGVSLPRPLITPASEVVAQVDGGWWRAYEWVEGEHCDAEPAPVGVARSLADQLGRLHALAYDAGSIVDGWYVDSIGTERIHAALDVAARHGWSVEHRRNDLIDLDAVVAAGAGGRPIGCHSDTGRSNVIVRDGECVFLDWDNAGPGYADREFASALLLWAADEAREPSHELISAMVRAYRAHGHSFSPSDLTVFSMRCSVWVHYVVMCCEHLADNTLTAEDLAFEAGALEALVNEDQGVARLERFLDAVPA